MEQEFLELFKPSVDTLKAITVKLYRKSKSTPHFMKARSIPLTLREKVGSELDRMVKSVEMNRHTCSGSVLFADENFTVKR